MKMSEMFKSELAEVPHNPSFEPFDIKYYSYGELRECSAEQETAVQHAVLTHDSNIERIKELEEENKKLREDSDNLAKGLDTAFGIVAESKYTAADKVKRIKYLAKVHFGVDLKVLK